jgi:hypothetical protein
MTKGSVNRDKTICKRGHEFSEENTYTLPSKSTRAGKRVCKICRNARQVTYRVNHPERHRATTRNALLKRIYGLSTEEFDALLVAQGYVCAICQQNDNLGRQLSVDHDHKTGKIRGLLCGMCNRAIGFLRDDPALLRRAIEYLVVP